MCNLQNHAICLFIHLGSDNCIVEWWLVSQKALVWKPTGLFNCGVCMFPLGFLQVFSSHSLTDDFILTLSVFVSV